MRRLLRIGGWAVAIVLALLLLLCTTLLIAGNTPGGRHLIEQLTARLTQGHVEIAGLEGSFPAAIDVRELKLSDERGTWLTGEGIALSWSPLSLLRRHVLVHSLHVGRLDIERAPVSSPPRTPRRSPPLPRIDVQQFTLDTLELGPALAGQRAKLSAHGNLHLVSLEDARVSLVARRTSGAGDYEVQARFDPSRMDGTVKLEEPAGGPLENLLKLPGLGPLSVAASLSGPRHAEQVNLTGQAGSLHARAQGTVDLQGRTADLGFDIQAGPMQPRADLGWQHIDLQGSAHGPWTSPQAQGRLQLTDLHLPGHASVGALTADLRGSSGAIHVQARGERLLVPGPRPQLLQGSPVTLEATLHLDRPSRPAELTAHHRLFSLKASGITAGNPDIKFDLSLTDLAPLAQIGHQQAQGTARITGDVTRRGATTEVAVSATGDVSGGQPDWSRLLGKGTQLRLAGTLTDQTLTLQHLQLTGRALSLSASGTAERGAPGMPFLRLVHVHGNMDLTDLAAVSPAAAGKLSLTARVEGPIRSLSAQVAARSTLSVRGSPLGTIQASLQARGLPSAPSATISARGSLDGSPLDLDASLERASGGAFHVAIRSADWKSAHAQGEIRSAAHLEQAQGSLALRIDRLQDLQPLIGKPIAGSLTGSAVLMSSGTQTHAQLQVNAQDVVVASVHAQGQLTASGPVTALPLRLAVQLPELHGKPATVNATGELDLPRRELDMESAQLSYRGQSVRLLTACRVMFEQGITIGDLKLGTGHAVLELEGRVTPTLDARASLQHVDADVVNAFIPGLLTQGTLSAQAQLKGSPGNPVGRAEVQITGLHLAEASARSLPALDAQGTAQLRGDRMAALDARLAAGSASQLTLHGEAPLDGAGALDLTLAGKLDLALANPLLETRGRRAQGELAIQAKVTGTPPSPQITGNVELARGDLRDYNQGVHLSSIKAVLVGSHGALQIKSLSGRAATGDVSVTGLIGVLQPKIPVQLHLTARNAQPLSSDILTANLDADLKATGTLEQQVNVSGTIHVNRADIGIPNSLPPNVAVLDVRRPGQRPAVPPEHRLRVGLDISLDAPRQILVKGRGLDAELGGNVHIRGTTAAPVVSGGFDLIRGTFSLASTPLTFTTGRVSFNGAGLKKKIDPTLDFTAQSTVADTTAILRVTGLADSPQFQLSSTPQELPQDEILARLLFGQSASQLTAGQIVQIGAALTTLTGAGGGLNPLVAVQKTLGLDRLTVSSGTPNGKTATTAQSTQNTGATLEAGRYVASNVFVAARQSTTGVTQLVVDVDLTRRLKVQTRLGNGSTNAQGVTPENDPGSSVGISYQFEY